MFIYIILLSAYVYDLKITSSIHCCDRKEIFPQNDLSNHKNQETFNKS